MRRGEVWRYRSVIEREGRSPLRLILSADSLIASASVPTVYGAHFADADPGSLVAVRVGEFGWANLVEIDRPLRSRLVERVGEATDTEMEQVDNALRATFEL